MCLCSKISCFKFRFIMFGVYKIQLDMLRMSIDIFKRVWTVSFSLFPGPRLKFQWLLESWDSLVVGIWSADIIIYYVLEVYGCIGKYFAFQILAVQFENEKLPGSATVVIGISRDSSNCTVFKWPCLRSVWWPLWLWMWLALCRPHPCRTGQTRQARRDSQYLLANAAWMCSESRAGSPAPKLWSSEALQKLGFESGAA